MSRVEALLALNVHAGLVALMLIEAPGSAAAAGDAVSLGALGFFSLAFLLVVVSPMVIAWYRRDGGLR